MMMLFLQKPLKPLGYCLGSLQHKVLSSAKIFQFLAQQCEKLETPASFNVSRQTRHSGAFRDEFDYWFRNPLNGVQTFEGGGYRKLALSQNRIHWAPPPPQKYVFKIHIFNCVCLESVHLKYMAPKLDRHVSAYATSH